MSNANQRPPVIVQTDNSEETHTLIELLATSNIVGRDRTIDRSRASSEVASDIGVLKRLVTTGEAGDYAATFLALRQIPFTSPSGDDNIREMSARMMQTAMTATDPTVRTITYCPQSGSCNTEPLTHNELLFAIAGPPAGDPALPSMRPNRGLPINRPVAAMTGFLDAQMNTNRYLKLTPSGQTLSLPETVADLQTNHPAAETNEVLTSCIANENTYSIAQCAIAGARAGITFNNESGVRYNGAQYLGTAQAIGQRR